MIDVIFGVSGSGVFLLVIDLRSFLVVRLRWVSFLDVSMLIV